LLIYFDVDDETRLNNRIQRDLAKRKRSWWKVYKRKF
jgi:uridine kinase